MHEKMCEPDNMPTYHGESKHYTDNLLIVINLDYMQIFEKGSQNALNDVLIGMIKLWRYNVRRVKVLTVVVIHWLSLLVLARII